MSTEKNQSSSLNSSNENKKAANNSGEDEDFELQRIRMMKMQQLLKKKQMEEMMKKRKTISLDDKIEALLKILLTPRAYSYLNNIKQKNQDLYNKIKSRIFPPQILSQINLLYSYMNKGLLRTGMIDEIDIKYLERQILGIKSQIIIKKRGEDPTSLDSYLKDKD